MGIPGIDEFENGKQSRMRATPKLIRIMAKNFGISENMIEHTEDETIIKKSTKDEDGYACWIDYDDTAKTRRWRGNLEVINRALRETDINIFISDKDIQKINQEMARDPERMPIDFKRKRLRRIFNNDRWNQGGRFYHGWWQEVPRAYRSYITINGQQTEEIDYSGMHFSILYAKVEEPVPEDPYRLPDVAPEYRSVIKKALNAAINAPTKEKAIEAISDRRKLLELPPNFADAESLIGALIKQHEPIGKFICSGEGLHAQFIDSCIAEHVMLDLLRQKLVALPIHDSFRIGQRHVNTLRAAMTGAFASIVKAECGIDAKAPAWRRTDELFPPPPEKLARRKSTIIKGNYRGYYQRELNWQRERLNAARAAARPG